MKTLLSALLLIALALPAINLLEARDTDTPSQEQMDADTAAVRRAGLDYLEAIYEVKPELIARSVHPELRKYGFYRPEGEEEYKAYPMTYEQLFQLAGRWNEDGTKADASSLKRVDVIDVMDVTAAIKVHASWGVDHMQLGKFEGKWKIINILWQSHPVE